VVFNKFNGLKMAPSSLSNIFKKHGVKRKKVVAVKKPEVHQQERIDRQIRFATDELERYIKDNKIILWLDETMFTR